VAISVPPEASGKLPPQNEEAETSVLGAILLTGYLGGATLAQLRVGDPFFAPMVLGVLLWGGLFLRDQRLRALIPLRLESAHTILH